jgi:hypothetical protein
MHDQGIYVIEDTQTSYWPEYGGSSTDLERKDTTMGYLKTLVDAVNITELRRSAYQPTYLETHIVAMHFYHNIVFIQKGDRLRPSQ